VRAFEHIVMYHSVRGVDKGLLPRLSSLVVVPRIGGCDRARRGD